MAFGDAAHQPEGSEGVVTLTAEFAQHRAPFLVGDFHKGLCAVAFDSAIGINKEHRLSLRQILSGKFHHSLLKFKAVDAGGKAEAVVFLQSDSLPHSYIDEFNFPFLGHGLQNLPCIPVVAGVVADGGFHSVLLK